MKKEIVASLAMGFVGGLLGSSISNLLLAATETPPKIIEAESFFVIDQKGNKRGVFGMDNGELLISLNGKGGRKLIQILTKNQNPSIELYGDESGGWYHPRIRIGLTTDRTGLDFYGGYDLGVDPGIPIKIPSLQSSIGIEKDEPFLFFVNNNGDDLWSLKSEN